MTPNPMPENNRRRDLAVVCRLNGHFQPDDSIFTDISARAPKSEGDGALLINPCGLRRDEVTAGNLVTVDPERRILRYLNQGLLLVGATEGEGLR